MLCNSRYFLQLRERKDLMSNLIWNSAWNMLHNTGIYYNRVEKSSLVHEAPAIVGFGWGFCDSNRDGWVAIKLPYHCAKARSQKALSRGMREIGERERKKVHKKKREKEACAFFCNYYMLVFIIIYSNISNYFNRLQLNFLFNIDLKLNTVFTLDKLLSSVRLVFASTAYYL